MHWSVVLIERVLTLCSCDSAETKPERLDAKGRARARREVVTCMRERDEEERGCRCLCRWTGGRQGNGAQAA